MSNHHWESKSASCVVFCVANVSMIICRDRFRDARGLQYVLEAQLEQLQNAHGALVDKLDQLSGQPSQSVINKTVECCLRPAAELLKK